MKHFLAISGMGHLRVELHCIQATLRVLHRRTGAVRRLTGDGKARRGLGDIVRMAHPNGGVLGHIPQHTAAQHGQLDLAVLGHRRRLYLAAQHPCHQLAAVANAQHRHAQLQHLRGVMGRGRVIHGIGTAGKDNALIISLPNGIQRGGIRQNFGKHAVITHTAGDQLIVLTAEIQNKNFFHTIPPKRNARSYGSIIAKSPPLCKENSEKAPLGSKHALSGKIPGQHRRLLHRSPGLLPGGTQPQKQHRQGSALAHRRQ